MRSFPPEDITAVTAFYKDPSNSYIGFTEMIFIAQQKIEGKNEEDKIVQSRKPAEDTYNLLRELEHKK